MSLAAQIAVAGTALLALTTRAAARKLVITNWGTGSLYYNTVPHGSPATLTTGNGTQITGAQPNEFQIANAGDGNATGLDVYVISGSTTTASVQSVPI